MYTKQLLSTKTLVWFCPAQLSPRTVVVCLHPPHLPPVRATTRGQLDGDEHKPPEVSGLSSSYKLTADDDYHFKVNKDENEHQSSLRIVSLGTGAKRELQKQKQWIRKAAQLKEHWQLGEYLYNQWFASGTLK